MDIQVDNLKKRELKETVIGSTTLMISFLLFVIIDIKVYSYPISIISFRIISILLAISCLVINFSIRNFNQKYKLLKWFYTGLVCSVLIFSNALILTYFQVNQIVVLRSIQVYMAIIIGGSLFAGPTRKYYHDIILVNIILLIIILSIQSLNFLEVILQCYTLLIFTIITSIYSKNHYTTIRSESVIKTKLEDKIDELEIEASVRDIMESKLLYLATYDGMTDCLNTRYGIEKMNEQYVFHKENLKKYALCYFDLDSLKYVNDNFGHKEGDQYIISFITIVKNEIRSTDILTRVGGDEFVLALNSTGYAFANEICHRIDSSVNRYNLTHNKPYVLSFSYGISSTDKDSTSSYEQLLSLADQRMLDLKRSKKSKNLPNSDSVNR